MAIYLVLVIAGCLITWLVRYVRQMRRENESIYHYTLVNKLIAFTKNCYAQKKLITNIMRSLGLRHVLVCGSKAPEAPVFSIDGSLRRHNLISDYSDKSPDTPLILCISSYN